jgi:hypothetical protein
MIAFISLVPQSPYPLWEQILGFLLAPPIVGCLFRLMAGGWAQTVQGKNVSSETKDRQRFEFWLLIGALYVGGIMIFAIAHFLGVKN